MSGWDSPHAAVSRTIKDRATAVKTAFVALPILRIPVSSLPNRQVPNLISSDSIKNNRPIPVSDCQTTGHSNPTANDRGQSVPGIQRRATNKPRTKVRSNRVDTRDSSEMGANRHSANQLASAGSPVAENHLLPATGTPTQTLLRARGRGFYFHSSGI